MRCLAFLLVPLMFASGCDHTTPTAPINANEVTAFDVTTAGLVTGTFSLKATCQNGVTGYVYVFYQPSGSPALNQYCAAGGGWADTVEAAGITGFRVGFTNIAPAPLVACGQQFYSVSGGDIPVRTKCTVNGLDVGGKPLAKMEIKYVK